MFDSLMDQIPLTPAAKALRDEILAIPRTDEPIMDDVPEDFEIDAIERLHALAVSGSGQAAPELRKLAARYPRFPKLLNYLYAAHVLRDEHRQAEAVLKRLAAEHPNYLFTRIALANKALEKKQPERAAAALNPSLALRDLYPDRDLFHLSELKNYYFCVARILAQRGEPQLARGVKAALAAIDYDEATDRMITHEIMMANLASMNQRIKADDKRRITVRPEPLPTKTVKTPRPEFHHREIAGLYEFGMELPLEWLEATLALPRETLVRDLIAVMDDCIERTPNFMRHVVAEGEDFAVFHALHLLAEIHGHEACPSLLRLLAMHPDAVDFWLGEVHAYIRQNARIIAGDLPACMAWLRQPGIHSRAKGMVTEAMEQIAKSDPARLPEISAGLGQVLAFLLDSPLQDNILDTGYLFVLIGTLAELRTTEHLPLIHKAYDKDLIELFNVGTFEEVSEDMSRPIDPPKPWLPMARQYEDYIGDENVEEEEEDDSPMFLPPRITPPDSVLSAPYGKSQDMVSSPSPAPTTGRNDPCPCGSGRKFKKCCMR